MSSYAEALSGIVYRLRSRGVMTQVRAIEAHQWLGQAALSKICDDATRRLACHAAENTPYYRELFKASRLNPRALRFPEDWERVPILEKESLRERNEQLVAPGKFSQKASRNHSGGSTGIPVSFLGDPMVFRIMDANLHVVFSWAGWRPGEMRLMLWGGGRVPPVGGWFDRAKIVLGGRIILPVYTYDNEVFSFWVTMFQRFRPTILYAYPSVATEFALWLEKRRVVVRGLKGVFCSAEILFPSQREVLERVFGCRVYNQYGCREAPAVACECPEGNMHIFSDLNRVEFVPIGTDDEAPRRIVVTPLFGYAQPLLRYDLGDMGLPSQEPCHCGRGYPLMDIYLARDRDHLVAEDGRRVYPGFFTRLLDGREWVRRFQFRQSELRRIELLLELESGVATDSLVSQLEKDIKPRIEEMMGRGVMFAVKQVESISRSAAGKYRYVLNDLAKPEK